MKTISHRFFDSARTFPDKTAIWSDGLDISYQALAAKVLGLSAAMRARGVMRGEHIGVLLPNSIEFIILMLAAADIGAVLVPLNTSLPPSAIETAFRASDVKHIIAYSWVMSALIKECESSFSTLDGLKLTIGEDIDGIDSFEDAIAEFTFNLIPFFGAQAEDPYILTMTSGSTGDPKPIVLTQRTKINRVQAAVEMYGVKPSDKTLAATPLYHSLAERLVLIPLLTGGTSILMSRFSPSEWMRIVAEQAVTFTIAVSSQLSQIANLLAKDDNQEVASLRCIVSSSALLDTSVKEYLVAKLNCEFHECYGASEIAIATNLNAANASQKLKTVGNPAFGVEIRIIGNLDEQLNIGEAGEIVCKTPMLFGGYYKRPEQTKAALWGEFFRTGDLGRLDEDGFLYFLGRKKEIIITGGINVYPADVETVVMQSGMVNEVAAFSIPDHRLGEIIGVAIAINSQETFNLKALRLFCAKHLADYQQPSKWFVLPALPKNPMGKIMKKALQLEYGSSSL